MAKKKRSLPKGPKAVWPIPDVITLLGWLDHSLGHIDLDFESTVVFRLGGRYTLRQIDRKLSSLWCNYGSNNEAGWPPSLWKKDLLVRGSACLDCIDALHPGISTEISKAARKFEDEYASTQAPPAVRRLRSSSRQNNLSPPRTTADSDQAISGDLRKRSYRPVSKSLTPSAIKREIDQIQPAAERGPSVKRRLQKSSEKPTEDQLTTPSQELTGQGPEQRQPLIPSYIGPSPVVEDSDSELSDLRSEDVEDYQPDGEKTRKIRCICGATASEESLIGLIDEFAKTRYIQCRICSVWQHMLCVRCDWHATPEHYMCEICEPKGNEKEDRRLSSHTVGEDSSEWVGLNPQIVSVASTTLSERPASTSPTASKGSTTGIIDVRLRNAKEKISDLEQELLESKLDLSFRDKEVSALKRQIVCLRAAQKMRDEQSGCPIEQSIEHNLTLERKLIADLNIREENTKFTRLTSTSREWFGTTKVKEGFVDIYSQSRQSLWRHDSDSVPFVPDLAKHGDLGRLVSRCSAIPTEYPKKLQEAMCKLATLAPEAVVRSLITSALAEWVFDTDFPKFDDCSSELLRRYRELLATQDGAVTLRNIDLAVRDGLTKSSIFQKQEIPGTARKLAIKLSQTLNPLFSNIPVCDKESDWDDFATWRDDKQEWMDRRERFFQMFKFALETKADSCLNIQDYEMLIYPQGARFDKRTMDIEGSDCMKYSTKDCEGMNVELCIEAAVFAHSRRPLSEDSSITEAIVTSKNFVNKDKKDRIGIEPAVKAVVILSDTGIVC